jgi:hypothetical protein
MRFKGIQWDFSWFLLFMNYGIDLGFDVFYAPIIPSIPV